MASIVRPTTAAKLRDDFADDTDERVETDYYVGFHEKQEVMHAPDELSFLGRTDSEKPIGESHPDVLKIREDSLPPWDDIFLLESLSSRPSEVTWASIDGEAQKLNLSINDIRCDPVPQKISKKDWLATKSLKFAEKVRHKYARLFH